MSANNWANRVKQDLSATPTKQLKAVGGAGNLPPISTYFQFGAVKENAPPSAKQLMPGTTISGTFEGSFTTKKFGTTYHKVQTSEGLIAVPGATQVNNLVKRVALGSEIQIVYNGKETIKKGNYAGKQAHSFNVAASDVVAA